MKLRISAKCSDMFYACLIDDKNKMKEYDGYVPTWFPNKNVSHYGDYVDLIIDVETGKILNWSAPTQEDLNKTFSN